MDARADKVIADFETLRARAFKNSISPGTAIEVVRRRFAEPDPLAEELRALIVAHGTGAGNLDPKFLVLEVGRIKQLLAKHGYGEGGK